MLGAISSNEFTRLLQKCLPPSGNVRKLGVAFSGGPDSLALLHLLNQGVHSSVSTPGLPQEIYAITVDHQLQAASASIAAKCEDLAQTLKIPHHVSRIEWGRGFFPVKPTEGEHFEALARDCRYRLLFDSMSELGLDCIAFGHHLDDQIETMVMRYTKGTRGLGLAGMKPCRRWGMGNSGPQDPLRCFGLPGMAKWIIRPFLSIKKRRCVATCNVAGLAFVEDQTNFQPALTARNEIRSLLSNPAKAVDCHTSSHEATKSGETTIEEAIRALTDHTKTCHSPSNLSTQLSTYILSATFERERQDLSAEAFLRSARKHSPLGTFALDTSLKPPNALEGQRGILLRILRYISPLPWGSPRAEAGRQSKRIDRLRDIIWGSLPPQVPCRLTVGGQVLWSFHSNGLDRLGHENKSPIWLASRLPPARKTSVDVSLDDIILNGKTVTLLWDGRFRITIHPQLFPDCLINLLRRGLGLLVIVPHGKYCEPTLRLRMSGVHSQSCSFNLLEAGTACYPIPKESFRVEWGRPLFDQT